MDNLPISVALNVPLHSANMAITNKKKEGKDSKRFSTLLEIARISQVLKFQSSSCHYYGSSKDGQQKRPLKFKQRIEPLCDLNRTTIEWQF